MTDLHQVKDPFRPNALSAPRQELSPPRGVSHITRPISSPHQKIHNSQWVRSQSGFLRHYCCKIISSVLIVPRPLLTLPLTRFPRTPLLPKSSPRTCCKLQPGRPRIKTAATSTNGKAGT